MNCTPPGVSFHGISQARILEWLPFPSLRDLPDPAIKLMSPASLALRADDILLSHQGSLKIPKGFVKSDLTNRSKNTYEKTRANESQEISEEGTWGVDLSDIKIILKL